MKQESAGDSDRQAEQLLSWIRALVRRFQISERADMSCCGMTVAQAAILEALREHGPLRLGSLSRKLGIAASTLSRNLERVEARGWVERSTDERDARAFRLRLSAAGVEMASALEAQDVAFARQVLAEFPERQRGEVLNHLHALVVAVGRVTESCCPGAFEHLFKDLKQLPQVRGER